MSAISIFILSIGAVRKTPASIDFSMQGRNATLYHPDSRVPVPLWLSWKGAWGKPFFGISSHGLRFACPRCCAKQLGFCRATRLNPRGWKNGFPRNNPSQTRLHCSGYRRCPAGAERACLRVLRGHVPACPAAAFHLPRLSLGAPGAVLSPSSHAILILLIYSPFVKGLSCIVHNRRGKERFGLIFQRKGDILKAEVKGGLKKWQ